MAHRAVLAGRRLVLQHHGRGAAIVREAVGTAAEIDDLVALDRAGARIDRIGADAREVVDVEGEEASLGIDREAALDAVVAGMDVAAEGLEAVGDELHRPTHDPRHAGHRHLVGIDMDLDAVGAADILADDAYVALRQPELGGEDVLHHVRRLRRMMHGERAIGAVVVGDDGARLQRHAGMAAGVEGRFHHLVRRGDGAGDVACLGGAGEDQIVAELGMDDHRAGAQRRLHVDLRRQRLELDGQGRDAVLGRGAAFGDDGDHRLALPGRALQRQRILRRRLHALQMREHRDPRVANLGKVRAREDSNDARNRQRRGGVDRDDARMGMGRAVEGGMDEARQVHVIGIGGATLDQLAGVGARHRPADIGIRQVLAGQAERLGRDDLVHQAASRLAARAFSTSSTASTMAW